MITHLRFTLVVALMPACSIAATSDPADAAVCKQLLVEYDGAEKAIASIDAHGFNDNSAPRETNRLLRILTIQHAQGVTLDLLIARRCSELPRRAPSGGVAYIRSALACTTSEMQGKKNSPECDASSWKSDLSDSPK